jgi:hypothetical protein
VRSHDNIWPAVCTNDPSPVAVNKFSYIYSRLYYRPNDSCGVTGIIMLCRFSRKHLLGP